MIQVLARALEKRSGQIGMAVFATGTVSSVLSAVILRLNIYSVVLFCGFGIILIGLVWMLCVTVMAAVEVFRGATTSGRQAAHLARFTRLYQSALILTRRGIPFGSEAGFDCRTGGVRHGDRDCSSHRL